MSKHPPGLDGSRYRCCCNHVNEGALIVGLLGLLLTWYNPVSIVAHIILIIGYLAQNHRFHYCYIVLGGRVEIEAGAEVVHKPPGLRKGP
ncbi:hypothetical protein AAVH_30097 [Aphelenchoides avenae]|nr:hypothetical protein AAVH_30097 [Aphelenchus avenae]